MGDDATDHEKPMCCAPGVLTECTIMAMCRSGGRSAIAVNLLAQAGFKHDYNIVYGMVVVFSYFKSKSCYSNHSFDDTATNFGGFWSN